MVNSKKNNGASGKDAPTLHQDATTLSAGALAFALICTLAAFATCRLVLGALESLGVMSQIWYFIFVATVALVALLFRPAYLAAKFDLRAKAALAADDVVQARIEISKARENSFITFGWGIFALILLAFICFLLMNDVAVGKTFFLLPLMQAKWWLVTTKFFSVNLVVCLVAEALVLIWGLAVALARLVPGPAGKPIRALAIFYCDVFRGLPAVVTLYLIGFGIPTSGLSDMIVPFFVGWFVDLSTLSPAEYKTAIRVPVIWWCIIALTLTYGAYVAEVYRSGIESIHQSQFMAARSLGLTYFQTMRHVIIPQAVRRIMAPLLNDFIGLQKDTALVQVVGLIDSFSQSKIIAANAFNLSAVTVVAILFVIFTIPQARLVDRMLERDNARMRAGS